MGSGGNVRLRFTKKLYKLFIKELPPIFKILVLPWVHVRTLVWLSWPFFYQSYFQDEHKMLLLMANYDAKMTYSFNSNYFFFRFCLRRPFWNQNRIKMAWISILSVKTFKLSNQVQFFSFIGSRPDYCLASSCHPLTYSQSMCPLSNCQTKPYNSL